MGLRFTLQFLQIYVKLIYDLPRTFDLNYFLFENSCLILQFLLIVNVLQMFRYSRNLYINRNLAYSARLPSISLLIRATVLSLIPTECAIAGHSLTAALTSSIIFLHFDVLISIF